MADRSMAADQSDDLMEINDEAGNTGRVRIIVIDTLTNILAPILAGSVTQGREWFVSPVSWHLIL